MLKKVAKTLDEMSKNEDLMAGIFGQEEEGVEGQQPGQRRLVTIGEDGEDQFDTKQGLNRRHVAGDDYEEDYDE
jgi:hypothetical protein